MFASTVNKLLLGTILSLTLVLPAWAGLVQQSYHWAVNADGSYSGLYPLGDKPPDITALSWDISDYLVQQGWDDLLVGTSKNTDLRSRLSGTNSASGSSTISLLPVAGTTPATAGITITSSCGTGSGSCISYDGVGAASTGTFRAVATDGTGDTQSAIKSFTITNPASVPGQVTGVSATVNSSSAITVSWDATAGATSYKAKRDGAVIQSGVTDLFYQHTGLAASTPYDFSVIGTNATGDGTESTEVTATTTAASSAFNPPYPRTWCRQCFSNMNVLDVTGSSSDFIIAADHIAKFHSGMFTGSKGTTFGGGTYNVGTYINRVKSSVNYNSSVGSAFVKYTNNTQISSPTGSTDAAMTFIRAKAEEEAVGTCGSWAMMENDCVTHRQGKTTVWEMNFNSWATPDAENGLIWAEWYPHFWYAAPTGTNDGIADGDYTMSTGHGISEGQWDGIFMDDQSMQTGQGSTVSGADQDGDGTSADNDKNDPDVVLARSEGFVASATAWRDLLFPFHPAGTLQFVTGNLTAISLQTDFWPLNMRTIYNGGLMEEWTGKSKGQGWGSYEIHDCASCTPPQLYSGMIGANRRMMENTISPRIAAFGHENGTPVGGGGFVSEFRTKWGCKPGNLLQICDNKTKTNGFIREDGVSKYPGHAPDLSDFRLAAWATSAVTVLDNGFVSINQNSPTWDSGIPWYDEWQGGSQINQPGWLGYPVAGSKGAPQRAAADEGVYIRYFDNGVVISNPPRGTPTTDQGKTVDIDAAGSGKRWKRLCATVGGFSTDGRPGGVAGDDNYSGTQNADVNTGAWVGAENTATTITIKEMQGIFLWRAPSSTTLACP